jgi:sugar lactone lactonase YvrE
MKKSTTILMFTFMLTLTFYACKKSANLTPDLSGNRLGSFDVLVTERTASSVSLKWRRATNNNNADSVKYKVYLNDIQVATALTDTAYVMNNITSDYYIGKLVAYTSSGDTSSASFIINAYTTTSPAYYFVTGFYRVTETTTILSNGSTRNYTFAAQAYLINDSTIQFVQNRRNPRTWWTVDFPAKIYPSLGDSLIVSGITPRGRIINQNLIRMGYLYGSSVVYDVKQIWEKLSNPADTSTIVYNYPSVPNMITTIAGSNTSGSGSGTSGDGGPALSASLLNPMDMIADNSGNVYFTDGSSTNYSIRKVGANGIITRFAGNNTAGYSGDGGQANVAQLNNPWGLAFDNSGNLLIADVGNRIIRSVAPNGIITTIAGTPGVYGYSGDGGQATAAQLGAPAGMCVDAAGNIYFADPGKNVIRKIHTDGIITTIAGNGNSGYSGDGGQATAAKLNSPYDVCVDASGNLYVADKGNHAIRKINPNGIITTVAGIGGSLNYGFTGDEGNATAAKLNNPQSVSVDVSGNLFISDNSNSRIRKVNTSGIITTIAGNGQSSNLGDGPIFYGGDYGPATNASVFSPYGNYWINNTLYIASSYRIRKVAL